MPPSKHTTSFRHPYDIQRIITLKRRRTDVKTTSCAYWAIIIQHFPGVFHIANIKRMFLKCQFKPPVSLNSIITKCVNKMT